MNNILENREWNIQGDWYEPLRKLKSYTSVVRAEHLDTCSSAGDWSGMFVQKIGRNFYAIPFSQENNYPRRWGYTLWTGEPVLRYNDGDLSFKDVCEIFFDLFYE